MKKIYEIGDIVFVSNYKYKNGESGKNHIFVIISKEEAIEIDYFGFLISSQIQKNIFPYNIKINRNIKNNLYKNSIIKCDDLIKISEKEIIFKIGEVSENELANVINLYKEFLKEN